MDKKKICYCCDRMEEMIKECIIYPRVDVEAKRPDFTINMIRDFTIDVNPDDRVHGTLKQTYVNYCPWCGTSVFSWVQKLQIKGDQKFKEGEKDIKKFLGKFANEKNKI